MKGHIRWRHGSWEIFVDYGRDEAGKRQRETKTVHGSKRDAQRTLRGLLSLVDAGVRRSPSKRNVGEHLKRWLESRIDVERGTWERYAGMIKRNLLPVFGQYSFLNADAASRPKSIRALVVRRTSTWQWRLLSVDYKGDSSGVSSGTCTSCCRRILCWECWRSCEASQTSVNRESCSYRLVKLRPQDIQRAYSRWLESGRQNGRGGLSAQTVIHRHRVLHQALAQAVRWNLISFNPTERVKPPRVTPYEPPLLDESAAIRMIEALKNTRLMVPIVLAMATGIRRGEILGLRWADIDLEHGFLRVKRSLAQVKGVLGFRDPKSVKGLRTIALPVFATECLRRHRRKQMELRLRLGPSYNAGDLVCCRPDGRPWAPATFTTVFADAVRRHKLPRLRFHDIRHAHATWSARYGQHPKVVSERLGHSSTRITMDTYTSVAPGMQELAAKQLDQAFATVRQTSFGNRLQTDDPDNSVDSGDSRKAL